MVPAAPSGAREVRARSNGNPTRDTLLPRRYVQLGLALAQDLFAHLHTNEPGPHSWTDEAPPRRVLRAADWSARAVQHVSVTCHLFSL